MAVQLDKQELYRLARMGAEARLAALDIERGQILRTFPELASGKRSAGARGATADAPVRRTRRQMSAAEKKAVSLRMKKYWAARRKQAKPAE